MATYAEIFSAADGSALLNKIAVACCVQAEVVRAENGATANHANRLLWAKQVFSDPPAMARRMVWAILAQNASATLSQIQNATDATLLSATAAAVDVFATGA